MGGSGVSGDFIRIILRNSNIPVYVCKDSVAPHYVDAKSLVIAASYSGKTWETLTALHSCISTGATVAVVTSSHELISLCKHKSIPAIQIPENGQARASFGYLLVSVLNILQKAGIISPIDSDISESVRILNKIRSECGPNASLKTNRAYTIALEFLKKLPIIYGESNFTDAVALRWKQLLNENSKAHCYCDNFPELLHNEIEVWHKPSRDVQSHSLLLLRDLMYEKETGIKEKVDATRRLVQDCGTSVFELWSEGESELARLLSLNYFGDFVSIYLAIARGIDPSDISNIQAIKKIGFAKREAMNLD
jgi:glucose/mannose-6-phosphate isomerase